MPPKLRRKLSKRRKRNNNGRDRFIYERRAAEIGNGIVAGIDEAGRGPLAGPVVAAAVVVQKNDFNERIDDSKKLTERMRERAFIDILKRCDVGIGVATVDEIDRLNILQATLMAMKRAVGELSKEPGYLLIDGKMNVPLPMPREYIINGETHSISIACASIIAKVFRDRLMREQDKKYSSYGFAKHKGYGTREHMDAIRKYGLSPIHRQTFGPFGKRRKLS